MKKLGLRVLAGSLAALMVASTFAPVKVANATSGVVDVLNSSALKTLYITEGMVDADGEIVISGETWDRVVISKEAAAKEIYLDEVKVGELVVESGNSANIQLWKVDAEQVTVKEPELVALTVSDLRSLLADPATQQQAMNLYEKAQTQNERILKKTPTIVTMEDATVGEVVARANARLELGAGSVGSLALEASDKVERVNVTVENYDGNVSYKGTDTLNVMNFKSVNSKIKNLTVEESTANNYFNVKNKDSVAVEVEVAGNAQVSLNIPMGTLNIAETATKAQVAVLNAVEEMNVAANGAQVEISPIGNVTSATVDGDNVTIGGAGVLAEVNINGKGAYVSTEGTDVEGENTYVKPEYVAPKVEIKDIDMTGGDGAEVTKNSNGSATIKFTGQYKTASFAVPSEVDVSRIASVVLNITTNAQFCVKLVAKTGAEITVAYPGYGITEDTKDDYLYSYSPAQYKLAKIDIMSLSGAQELTINSIVFNLLDKAPEAEPTPTPMPAPSDGILCATDSYVVHNFTDYDLRDYAGSTVKLSVKMLKIGELGGVNTYVQTSGSYAWIKSAEIGDEWTSFEISYDVPASFANGANPEYIGFRTISGVDYTPYTFYYKDLAFTGTPTSGGAGDPTPTPTTAPMDPTPTPTTAPTPTPVPDAYYYESFSTDYFTGGSAWDVTKGLANYKLSALAVVEDAATAYDGDCYIKVKMNDVYNGITYTLDNSEGAGEATFTFTAYLKKAGEAGAEFVRMGVGNTYTDASYWTATDSWTQVTKTVTVAAGESTTVVFSAQDPQYCDAADGQMAEVYLDCVMITKEVEGGATPTPTPTPYYSESFSTDYFTGGSAWDVTKGLANYKLSALAVVEDAATAYDGDCYIKVKMNDVYNGITYTLDNSEGTGEATFTFTAYLKKAGDAGAEFVRMGVGNTYTDTSYWTATDSWTQITKTVVVAAGESATVVFSAQDPQYCDAEDGQMAEVYLDCVMITKE